MGHRLMILVFCMMSFGISGQPQLAILRSQKVISTIRPGTTLDVKRRSRPGIKSGFLVQAEEFRIITSRDTIALRDIRCISTRTRKTFLSGFGKLLAIGGFGYFGIDLVNNLFISDRPTFDRHVTVTAAALVSAGAPMMLVRRKWDRPGRGNTRILTVDYKSRFYRE